MAVNLNEKFVGSLKFEGKAKDYRDIKIKGLIVTVNKYSKTYKWQREVRIRDASGQTQIKTLRRSIGTTDTLTLAEARVIAAQQMADAHKILQEEARLKDPESPSSWTISDMYHAHYRFLCDNERSPAHRADYDLTFNKYLRDWKHRQITKIKKSEVRAKHHKISEENGPVQANHVMRNLRAAYNYAIKLAEEDEAIFNPVKGLSFNHETPSDQVIDPDDFPTWPANLRAVKNPIRQNCHLFGLLTGLRPNNRVQIETEWLNLDLQSLRIPQRYMKGRKDFMLPLSAEICEILQDTIMIGEHIYGPSPWVFPTINKDHELVHIQEWKEQRQRLPTGHVLRHSYRTVSRLIGVPDEDSHLLMGHKIPGMDHIYLHESPLFKRLQAAQSFISKGMIRLLAGQRIEFKGPKLKANFKGARDVGHLHVTYRDFIDAK